MTYIPAENDPQRRQHSGTNREKIPTEAMNADTSRITASSDPNTTRPMPSMGERSSQNRYELSADPATTTLETPPWQTQQTRAVHTAPQHIQPSIAPQAPQAVRPLDEPVYPVRPAHPHTPSHQPSGGYGPARDLSFGVVLGLLLRLLFLAALAGAVSYYALRTVGGQWADDAALQDSERVLGQLPATWAYWMELLPVIIGLGWAFIAVIVAASARRWTPFLVSLVGGVASIITVQLLKRELLTKASFGIQETTMNSLPSGHTAAAAAAAMVAVITTPARWRGFVGFLGALTSGVAGISTVLNEWHRPMDAVVSLLVVACWAVTSILIVRCLVRPERYASGGGGFMLVAAILLLLVTAGGLAVMQTVAVVGLPLATGAAGILGFSLLAHQQMVRAARPRLRQGG